MSSKGKRNTQAVVVVIFLTAMVAASALLAQTPNPMQTAPATEWRPNQAAAGARFVGAKACAACHRAKVTSQQHTPMGTALAAPANCDILRDHPDLKYRNGPYSYQLKRDGNRTLYSVTDGTRTLAAPIFYCFGKGEAGQTYVLERDGKYYESRVSFYNDIRGLDVTMGHVRTPPATLEEAMGREMAMEETRNCFGCHSTNALDGKKLQFDHMMEGVSCEACHGPGEKHIAAMQAGDSQEKRIFNPKSLSTEDLSNFCGTCHRTWEQVALMGLRGVNNVRFQPYRLTNSKCYDSDDKRISCAACHNPHEDRQRSVAFYDAKCIACHNATAKPAPASLTQSSKRIAAACPVGKEKCSTCHMPRYEIPGSHFTFTDHHIRIVKPGEVYPN